MKLRFFKSEREAFILNEEEEVAAGILHDTLAEAGRDAEFYEAIWPMLMTRSVESLLAATGLAMEDFTEVDSYGKPLQEVQV